MSSLQQTTDLGIPEILDLIESNLGSYDIPVSLAVLEKVFRTGTVAQQDRLYQAGIVDQEKTTPGYSSNFNHGLRTLAHNKEIRSIMAQCLERSKRKSFRMSADDTKNDFIYFPLLARFDFPWVKTQQYIPARMLPFLTDFLDAGFRFGALAKNDDLIEVNLPNGWKSGVVDGEFVILDEFNRVGVRFYLKGKKDSLLCSEFITYKSPALSPPAPSTFISLPEGATFIDAQAIKNLKKLIPIAIHDLTDDSYHLGMLFFQGDSVFYKIGRRERQKVSAESLGKTVTLRTTTNKEGEAIATREWALVKLQKAKLNASSPLPLSSPVPTLQCLSINKKNEQEDEIGQAQEWYRLKKDQEEREREENLRKQAQLWRTIINHLEHSRAIEFEFEQRRHRESHHHSL